MASASMSELASEPPALPLPTPPLSKAIFFFSLFSLCFCLLVDLILSVTPDKERNIKHGKKAFEEAAQKGAQLVLLPEIWNSPYSNDGFPVYAEDIDAGGDASPSTAMLSEVASRLKITIVGGSILSAADISCNTCCVFGSNGTLKAKHRKIRSVLLEHSTFLQPEGEWPHSMI
ncbi:phospholipid:diacylglycerol acyltransferase 1-like [Hibiscus syriacus]|uniref:Phospholipid:diacylglycerol acyltransferase 1-like n=1 Tax=Hibiscus syriacus TaxID=106335 RepID=A0A6A3BPB3_HIBSY|nr:phospholipid:diacylglycerol acyltransferase 1-like [Hibiscus syriacus]